jgi:hypothetical protein
MCTTLHFLLGDRHPHELRTSHTTRAHMLVIHRALLEWLITGAPPALWQLGCLHHDIQPPSQAHTGPYPPLSISAAAALPMDQPRRPRKSIHIDHRTPEDQSLEADYTSPISSTVTPPMHIPNGPPSDPRFSTESQDFLPRMAPQPIPISTPEAEPSETAAKEGHDTLSPPIPASIPSPALKPTSTTNTSSFRGHNMGPCMSTGAIRLRLAYARRLETRRLRKNKTSKQTMLRDHWPTLRSPSFPIFNPIQTPPTLG